MPSEVSYTGSHTNTDSFHSIVYSIIPVQLWGQLFRAFSHPANKNVGINWILVIFGMYILKYFGIKSLPFKLCLNDQYWPWQSHVRRTQIQPLIWLHFGKVPSTLQHKVVCCVPATLLAKTNLYSHSFRFNIKANKFNTGPAKGLRTLIFVWGADQIAEAWWKAGKLKNQGQKAQRYMTEGKKKLLLDYFIIFSTQKRALDNFFGKTKHWILR